MAQERIQKVKATVKQPAPAPQDLRTPSGKRLPY